MPRNVKLLLVITVFVIHKLSFLTFGLLCYTCSYTEDEQDNGCLLSPTGTDKVTNCSTKYCTITRQEAVSPAGKVISFLRDCQDNPLFLNAIKIDPMFKTFYRSCVMDMCNDSDGTQSATYIDPNYGAAENTVLKGRRNAAWSRKISNLFLVACVAIVLGYKRICLLNPASMGNCL